MMKTNMKYFALAIFVLMSAVAVAEDVNKRIDAASDGVVSIANVSGSVDVSGWSRNEVEVTGTLGRGVEELLLERDGDEVKIKVKAPKRGSHNISSDLVIKVPEKSSVSIASVSADIDIRNVKGSQHLNSVSGDIESEVFAADIEIVTVSGDVQLEGDDKDAHIDLQSVSGDIEAENLAGQVNANSVSGDITLVNSNFERVRLETVNGDIIFDAGLSKDGSFNLETINGDVDINFNDGVTGRFDIETFNGDISNCFGPEPVRTSKYTPGTELKFTEGKGTGRVAMKTLNGDLRLCKD